MSENLARQAKSFWEKKEGTTGKAVLLIGLVALAFYGNAILDGIKTLMQSLVGAIGWTFAAGAMAALLATAIMVISDARFQRIVAYSFENSMRKLTGLVIERDPIGILRGIVSDFKKKRTNMLDSMENLDGQIRKLTDKIDSKEKERVKSLLTAQQAQKNDMKAAMVLQARKAGRLQKSNLTLQGLLDRMKGMRRALQKAYEGADFMIQDMESEIEVKSDERAAILATHNAYTQAKAIISGESTAKDMYDQTLEFLADDYSMKVGEMESGLKTMEGFLQSVDLENDVYEQEAMDQFDAWEKKIDVLMLGPGDANSILANAINATPQQRQLAAVNRAPTTEGSGTFTDIFDKH